MNYTNIIDSYQAHVPVQYASNIVLILVFFFFLIDSEPHPVACAKYDFILNTKLFYVLDYELFYILDIHDKM